MAKRQLTLTGMLSGTKKMKSTESSNTGEADDDGRTERSEDVSPTATELSPQCDVGIETEIENISEGSNTGEADDDGRTERSEDVSPTATELSPQCDVGIETEIENISEGSNTGEADDDGRTERSEDVSPTATELSPQCEVGIETEIEKISEGDISECSSLCCTDDLNAFQPMDKQTLMLLSGKSRNFQPSWLKKFSWLTVCLSRKRVFCLLCRYAYKHKLFSFAKCGESAFTQTGYQNWKKALERFRNHESSHFHKEAHLKWIAQQRPTVESQLNAEVKNQQQKRRAGLVLQMRAIQYLTRQGIALQGHAESEGNLMQLMLTLSKEDDIVRGWLKEKRYTSPQIVNELLEEMGKSLLRTLLDSMKAECPAWFSVIADEATDVCQSEQLNVSIRWVDKSYIIHEDPIGLFQVPDTRAATLYSIIKDILVRCNLPIAMCRGQAYDGAANMQGKRSGVAARFLADNPAAVPVHCFAHSLNLCLQSISRKIVVLRDALELVREITKLIKFSPKRLHLFASKLKESDDSTVSLKSLCPTRWTARTAAIDSILKDYSILWKLWKKSIQQQGMNMA